MTNLNKLRMNDDVMLIGLEVIHVSTHYNKVVPNFCRLKMYFSWLKEIDSFAMLNSSIIVGYRNWLELTLIHN